MEPPGWHDFKLIGKKATRYAWTVHDGKPAWHARSEQSASLWHRSVNVAAEDLGEVEFSWWVPELIAGADLNQVDASDSPARVVFAFAGDVSRLSARNRMLFELARTLNGEAPPYATLVYVWDNRAPLEQVIPNARIDRIRKLVVESGPRHLRQWRSYRRDLAADFRRAFGEAPGALVSVGYMTDSDNTRSQAEAWYGEIRLH